ncbi:MAG: 16S rRNA (uracil(1498)-N(3))-methyltransferase [Nitrospinae bacterium]|nr:16S rRNA (uracil(1498)-N(3))-methyltransferase [Nitrospinota bacterium]
MRRFFTPPENISGDRLVIRGSDVAHIRSVLRLRPGDRVHVLDGRGNRYCAELTGVGRQEVAARIVSRETAETESPVSIRMGLPLLKGNKFDDILRKAVELGANRIVPLETERCVVKTDGKNKTGKTPRWRKIAEEASKQCGRSAVPSVEQSVQNLDSFCRENAGCDLKVVFWESEEKVRLRDIASGSSVRSIAFLTGPEGGLTGAEIETARSYGFITASMGPRILRAETAPIAVLSILQNLWGDL